jgi:rhamnosyltransferase
MLFKQQYRHPYEVIAVDSGSEDGAIAYLKKHPVSVVQIPPAQFNYANAYNRGVTQARGEYLVRLSGDCVPKNNKFLSELVSPLADPAVGATYGRYQTSGKTGYGYPEFWPARRFGPKQLRIHIPYRAFLGLRETGYKRQLLFNLAGGCFALKRSIWQQRPLNERLKTGEDGEYAWFLHLIGYDIVYVPQAVVIHEHPLIKMKKSPVRHFLKLIPYPVMGYWLKRLAGVDPYVKMRQEA